MYDTDAVAVTGLKRGATSDNLLFLWAGLKLHELINYWDPQDEKDAVESKISSCLLSGRPVVYVLHGHGTGGVLKSKIRGWLKSGRRNDIVKRWAPADQSEGGDAFTRLDLR